MSVVGPCDHCGQARPLYCADAAWLCARDYSAQIDELAFEGEEMTGGAA